MDRRLLACFVAAIILAGPAAGCGTEAGRWETPLSPGPTPSPEATLHPDKQAYFERMATIEAGPTAGPPLVVPVERDDEVWQEMLRRQVEYISPILRPAYVPPGFDTASIDRRLGRAVPCGEFAVEYQGEGRVLRVVVGWLNPPPPGPGGSNQHVVVRGVDATLQVGGSWSEWVLLWWREPGAQRDGIGRPVPLVDYYLMARGLSPEDLLAVAESMAPLEP